MAANWIPSNNRAGIQPIQTTNGALPSQYQTGQTQLFGQAHQLGEIITGLDANGTFGGAEFIYLEGVTNTVVGMLVTYDPLNMTTTLVPNTASQNNPVAVAMSANVGSQFGWYQISGVATIKKSAAKISPASKVAVSATAGRVLGGSTAGKMVMNAISVNAATVASATSTVSVLIQRPFMEPVAT
jgi:hypothetical protein